MSQHETLAQLQELLEAIDSEAERRRVLLAFQIEGQRFQKEQEAILEYARNVAEKRKRKQAKAK